MPTKTELKQREAISLFLTGKSETEVAEAIGVSRQTIWKWKRETDFLHDIVEAGEGILAEHTLAVSSLVDEALGVMSELLKSEDESIRFKAATTILNSASNWRAQRPDAPGHTSAENELHQDQVDAIMQIEQWKVQFTKQGGKPDDFTMWLLQGMPEIKGNGAEAAKSNEPAKPESVKAKSAKNGGLKNGGISNLKNSRQKS
ncbi:MAG: helix-turn-helix domain containing protein [Candidatus Poribacteria bacterium]|nr:helix-turn-helix domain containing protein [Candidatus Poribacteria bacterium]